MKKTLMILGLGLAAAASAETTYTSTELAAWDFSAGTTSTLTSTNGALTVSLDTYSDSPTLLASGVLQCAGKTNGRAWVDISSLGLNLRTDSFSITLDVTGLNVQNGPIFSLTSGASTTQTTAFGRSNTAGTWAFSANGGNMTAVTGDALSYASQEKHEGLLTVNFFTEEGVNYVSAVFNGETVVDKTQISYATSGNASSWSSASSDLTGLTLGGWGSTNGNGAAMDIKSLSISTLSVASIPEPTTATLSLLALAGLAARRRRK